MRHTADVLDEVKEAIVNAYQLKTKRSRNKISTMMDNETWMSAKTAVTEGFADGMLYTDKQESETVENSFMFSRIAIQNSISSSMANVLEHLRKIKPEAFEKKEEPVIEESRQAPVDLYKSIINNNERRLKNYEL
jgi:ATP-dependent Clp protease protease subunit